MPANLFRTTLLLGTVELRRHHEKLHRCDDMLKTDGYTIQIKISNLEKGEEVFFYLPLSKFHLSHPPRCHLTSFFDLRCLNFRVRQDQSLPYI